LRPAVDWTAFERWVTRAALVAAPLMAAVMLIGMVLSPHEVAGSDTAPGWGLWLGVALGFGMAVVVYALPQMLFGLALRSPSRERLNATALAAPIWAAFGLQPLIAALVGGWEGLVPLAVMTAAAAGVLDCFVFVVAWRGRSRLGSGHPNPVATHQT
jgi:hypothetical protein